MFPRSEERRVGKGVDLGGRRIIKKILMSFAIEKTLCISLSCSLVPVQYQEYKYGLLHTC